MSERVLHIVTGPTATGKTAFALEWAEVHGAEILSCDAVCVYRGMDIGSAKPTREQRARVPHHGLDLAEPSERYSVGQYVAYAKQTVERILSRGKRILVVGGSGFYLRSFFAPVVDPRAIPVEVTEQVEAIEARGGRKALRAALLAHDPQAGELVDLDNPRRTAPALARLLATGESVAEARAAFEATAGLFDDWEKRLAVIDRAPDDLAARIQLRTEQMLATGLAEEVEVLCRRGFERNPVASAAIGYREVLACRRGELTPEELPEAINQATLRLARKQRAWFRKQLPPHRPMVLRAGSPTEPDHLYD